MGRCLSCGVVTKIELIEKCDTNYKISEHEDDVIFQLNKYLIFSIMRLNLLLIFFCATPYVRDSSRCVRPSSTM